MTKRKIKRKKKGFIKRTFGTTFDVWDLALIVVLGLSLYFLILNSTWLEIIDNFVWVVFSITVGALFLKYLTKILRRAKR